MGAALAVAPRDPALDVVELPAPSLLRLGLPERLAAVDLNDLELAFEDPLSFDAELETAHLVVHRRGQPFRAIVTVWLGDRAWAMTADTARQAAMRLFTACRPYAAKRLHQAADDAEAMAHTLQKGLS